VSLDSVVRQLDAAMVAKKSPFRVFYGPERMASAGGGVTRIVIDDAGPGADTSSPVTATRAQHNVGQFDCGFTVTVYARSPKSGARVQDHRNLARRLFKVAFGQLNIIAKGIPSRGINPSWSGGFIVPDDLAGTEVHGFAVYQATLSIPDGIADLETTWAELEADFAEGVDDPGALGTFVLTDVEAVEGEAQFTSAGTTATVT
jgi:hypothetical protein